MNEDSQIDKRMDLSNTATVPTPNQDFFRFRIEALEIIDELQHQLRGEMLDFDKDGNQVYVQKFEPWANDKGISKILHIIYSTGLNKNIILGNLMTDQINMRCQSLWVALAKLLAFYYNDMGVRKENRQLLIQTVVYQVHSALSRSEGGKEADQISVASQRHEIYHEGLKQDKGSPLNPLSWFRGK